MATNLGYPGLGAPALNRIPRRPNYPSAGPNGFGAGGQRAQSPGVGAAGSALTQQRQSGPPNVLGQLRASHPNWFPGSASGGAAATSAAPPAPAAPAPPADNIGIVPADEESKAAAQASYGTNTGSYLRSLQDAAMAYGDPSIMAGLGLGTTVNPNSALALAALKAQQDTQTSGDVREGAGTFFSSLHAKDLADIGAAQQRAQLAGYTDYQKALGDYTTQMATALNALNEATNNANIDERQNAINNLPNPATAAGGFQGGSTSVTSRVPTRSGKTGAPKGAGKLSSPKLPKTPGRLGTTGRAGSALSNAPPRVAPVKKQGRVPGKRR